MGPERAGPAMIDLDSPSPRGRGAKAGPAMIDLVRRGCGANAKAGGEEIMVLLSNGDWIAKVEGAETIVLVKSGDDRARGLGPMVRELGPRANGAPMRPGAAEAAAKAQAKIT